MKRELLDNGKIWQKSDGRWIGLVRYKDEFGVAQRKSFSSKKKKPQQASKERDKIRVKKQAHGQKEGTDGTGIDAEVYDSQAAEGILTMLDYLISLGNQESEQDNEVDTLPKESFDFDNAYAVYLSDEDDGYDEDEEEYFGLSM